MDDTNPLFNLCNVTSTAAPLATLFVCCDSLRLPWLDSFGVARLVCRGLTRLPRLDSFVAARLVCRGSTRLAWLDWFAGTRFVCHTL